MKDDTLGQMLRFDAISEAERITGVSYKDESRGKGFDNPASGLGFAMMLANEEQKRFALVKSGDTMHGDTLERYTAIIERFGFEKVLQDDFASSRNDSESYFIYANRKHGLLLAFDTYYNRRTINSGKVYYNWRPFRESSEDYSYRKLTSSGCFTKDGVWYGDHDCREALVYHMTALDDGGDFVAPWVHSQVHSLLHYEEWRQLPEGWNERRVFIDNITNERINRLPEWVREFMGVSPR